MGVLELVCLTMIRYLRITTTVDARTAQLVYMKEYILTLETNSLRLLSGHLWNKNQTEVIK